MRMVQGDALASQNISSVTDNAAGDFTMNFNVDTASGNYCTVTSCQAVGNVTDGIQAAMESQGTGGYRIKVGKYSSGLFDSARVNAASFGGLT